jgi:hypothetical protein
LFEFHTYCIQSFVETQIRTVDLETKLDRMGHFLCRVGLEAALANRPGTSVVVLKENALAGPGILIAEDHNGRNATQRGPRKVGPVADRAARGVWQAEGLRSETVYIWAYSTMYAKEGYWLSLLRFPVNHC